MSLDLVREYLSYDPATGVFTWIKSPTNVVPSGTVAGYISDSGYRIIAFKGANYRAHRLAWWWAHGHMPPEDKQIDHESRSKDENRINNLRVATRAQNQYNSKVRKDNSSGFRGVGFNKIAKKWTARIKVSGAEIWLGLHETKERAARAYDAAALKYSGEFASLNFPNEGLRLVATN